MDCPVAEARFRCHLPAGVLDLRLRAADFVPAYRWSVPVRAGATHDLGVVELRPGASVVGRVQLPEAKPAGGCEVSLAVDLHGALPDLAGGDQLAAALVETRADAKGFFQFAGVAPGTYVVSATQAGFAPARVAGVRVESGLESEILQPLLLERPARFELALEPPLDPLGRPWSVTLIELTRDAQLRVFSFRGRASAEGRWARAGLSPGPYRLTVGDDDESTWYNEEVQIRAGQQAHAVELPVVPVRGTLTIGDEPAAGRLWLGGRHGRWRVNLSVDLEGRFEGHLPSEGAWEVEFFPADEPGASLAADTVEVERRPGQSYAELEIRLPGTQLGGEVVDGKGVAVPGARVSAFRLLEGRRPSHQETGPEGSFRFLGLPEGNYSVMAESGERASEPVPVALDEELDSPRLRLVLRSNRVLRGQVVSASGPMAGARIVAWPGLGANTGGSVVSAVSGPEGAFEITLPEGTVVVNLLVRAPGFAVRLLGASPASSQPLTVSLERDGGTLVLGSGGASPGRRLGPGAFLVHGGAVVPLPLLTRMLAAGQGGPLPGGPVVLPSMEFGDYSLCKGRAAIAAQEEGREPQAAECSSGLLLPYGELTLESPG